MKLNTNYTNALNNYVIVDTTEISTDYNGSIAENIFSWLGHSHIVAPNEINTDGDYKNYMQYLDAKLSSIRKTATFWDAYNIREAATDQNDFINKYSKLPNNSSLIINCGSFTIGNTTYERGSVVLKDFYGNQNIIKGKQNGLYVPNSISIDNSKNLKLSFSYQETADQQTKDLVVENYNVNLDNTSIYNDTFSTTAHQAWAMNIKLKLDKDNNYIMPFVECYIKKTDSTFGDQLFNCLSSTITSLGGKKYLSLSISENVPFNTIILIK